MHKISKSPNQTSKFFLIVFSYAIQLFFPSFISAQEDEIKFSHLTVEEGLISNAVIQILQDVNGFIWFGTYNGLERFDGYNFKAFLPEPNNPHSISNHSIWALQQDSRGNIWCGTQDGLNKFDRITEQFSRYKHNDKDPHSISDDHILCIFKDHSETLWIGTLNGLNKYNPETNNFTVYRQITPIPNPDSLNSVTCIQEDKEGNLWLGTWNGLIIIQKNGKIINHYFEDDPNAPGLNYRKIICLYKDNSQNIWVGTSTLGLQKYDAQTNKFTVFRYSSSNPNSISDDFVTAIYQDKFSNLWVGTKNGLNKLSTGTNHFSRMHNDPQKPLGLLNNEILSIVEDSNSLMWIGSAGGVSRFYQTTNKFNFIQENKNHPQLGLTNNNISALTIDNKNNVWAGSLNGLNKIESGTNKITQFRKNSGAQSIGSNQIMSIYQDHTGFIWIGTNDVSLNRYNPSTGEIKHYTYSTKNPNTISNEGVTTICEDRKGNMWFGTWWGLNRYDRNSDKFFRYFANPKNHNGLRVDLIWKVFEDSKGMIWIGTDGGGISCLNPETNKFKNFFHDSTQTNTISGNIGICILESSDGLMWFGTNNGLDSYDRKTGQFKSYSKEDGLPGIFVNSIVEEDNGILWIGTDRGLSRFDRRSETFTNFSIVDGLRDLDFSARASYASSDGLLYFGTKHGLMFFDPNTIREKKSTSPIVFTDLKVYNQSVPISTDGSSILNRSIIGAANIDIPYKDDVITLEFSLLDYDNIRENIYSYKLEGFDSKWNMVGNRNSATYTNLPPGEYKFIVRAYNGSGIKNQKEASILITIVPAFYQTLWFRISAFIVLISLGFIFVQTRTKKISEANRILESRVAERTKDLDSTINELSQEILERKRAEEKVQASLAEKEVLLKEVHHRVKNNLQVVSSLLFLQSKFAKDEATLNLFKDSQNRIKSMALIHEKLYQSKDFSKINLKDYVSSFLEHLNSSHQHDTRFIKTEVQIDDVELNLDTSISCGLIVNELTTNAFKYAFPIDWVKSQGPEFISCIKISAKNLGENKIILIIQDNGIGVPVDLDIEKSESLGLKIVTSMINQLSGTIDIKNEGGTTFTITFTALK